MGDIGFVDPELGRPSGGATYNDEVYAAWPVDAPPLTRTRIPLSPHRSRDEVAGDLAAALDAREVSVVDGLLGCEHPDVVASAEQSGHRVVLLVHMPRPAEGGLTPAERERLTALEARAISAASAVIAPSHWLADDLQRRYGRGDVVVATPGVRPAAPAPRQDPPVLVQLGAVGPLKNQLLTARALRACAYLPFRLRFVGPVVDERYAAELLDTLAPLGARASLEPPVGLSARDELLAGASLLLSVATQETFGLVITEALARGVPAIVGRGTGAEEALALGGGIPGCAVPTDDPAGLTEALRAFLADAGLRGQWGDVARDARERLPSWASTARAIAGAREGLRA
ncbi:glycosyltransferase family 4 protein [Actinomycetota bacterium]